MKGLLKMAREKQQQQPKQFPKPSKIQLMRQKVQYEEQYEEEQSYEPDDEEIIAYGEYLGIKLPEEQDLLDIARQGLMADLPEDWANEQTDDGEIIYINLATGQRTMEHPCDQYYKQLVIKQRRRREQLVQKLGSGNSKMGYGMNPGPQISYPPLAVQKQNKAIDPLVKMQMQKKRKKLQEQRKKQFDDQKAAIKKKYSQKKQGLQKQLKQKLRKQKQKYDIEITDQRTKMSKKLSQKEKQEEEDRKRELEKYEKEMRIKIENKWQNIKKDEMSKIEKDYKAKKDAIHKNLEAELKKQKKQLDDQIKQKLAILTEKQKETRPNKNGRQKFEEELRAMKNKIIERRMKEYEQEFKESRKTHESIFRQKISQMQALHEDKVKQLQNQGSRDNSNKEKINNLIKEIQENEKSEMKEFEYELSLFRETTKSENQQKINEFRHRLIQEKQERLYLLNKEFEVALQKHKSLKDQEYQKKLSQAEKNSKESLLNHIRRLKQKFAKEEQMIELEAQHNHQKGKFQPALDDRQQKKSIEMMEGVIKNLDMKEKKAEDELQAIRSEIRKINSKTKAFHFRLGEDFLAQYNILKQKILEKDD